MPEPRRPMIQARVSTALLERAAHRLQTKRYPRRLQAIDSELQRRYAEERGWQEERRAA